MNFYVENETEEKFSFDIKETAELVCRAVLTEENCPYEVQVNIVLTDDGEIREMNRVSRGIDRETDVLSFPNVDFSQAGVFDIDAIRQADYFDPDTGELVLGDIMISVDRVKKQAADYGHSVRREYSFLVAHSMLHLCGYDHEEENQARTMERKQEEILEGLGITREK